MNTIENLQIQGVENTCNGFKHTSVFKIVKYSLGSNFKSGTLRQNHDEYV